MTPAGAERAREVRRAGYRRNRDKEISGAAKYRSENREKINAYARERHASGLAKGTSYYRSQQTPEQRENELAQKRRHYQENRESALAYAAKYREENLETLRERDRGRYGRQKEYFKQYNERNADRIRARRRIWTEANRERIAAKNAEWTQNNLDKHRTHQHNRRAKLKANGGTLSSDICRVLMAAQMGKCACCKSTLDDKYHLDHIVPIARGGANSDDNVQLLCATCNLRKGAKHPVEFMQSQGFLL